MKRTQMILLALASLLIMACGETETPQPRTAAPLTPAPAPVQPSTTAPVEMPLLLPGKLNRNTTIADLQALFGAGNVRIGDVPGPEGSTEQGAVLFPDDPTRRAYVYFHDDAEGDGVQPRQIASVLVFDSESRWQLERGDVRIGMPFEELRRRNGKPFQFGGLDWDYGGYVSDWNGGTLAERDGDTMLIGVRLGARDPGNAPVDAYPTGEGGYSSDDPAWPRMAGVLVVSQISVASPRDTE